MMERAGTGKDVIIAGAGLAGLSAGYELSQAGYNVTILEARMRPGGRVYTLREPFSDGLYAEAGAIFLPSIHGYTMGYAKHFELPLVPVSPHMLSAFSFIRGKRISLDDPNPDWSALGMNLTPEEKELGYYGMLDKYLGELARQMGDPTAPGWPSESFKRYDDLNFSTLLREQGASPDAIEWIRMGYLDVIGGDKSSGLYLLRDYLLSGSCPEFWAIKGGTDLLPKAFASRLQDKIHYGAAITHIEHDQKGVRVTYSHGGQPRTMSGDYLISTVPFPVLQDIEITPKFSPGKQKAIADLPYTSAVRVFLQCKERFWGDEAISGATYTDLPIGITLHATEAQPGMRRGIIEAYMYGEQAKKAMSLSIEERINFVLEHIEEVFPGMRENFEGGFSKSWDDDRFIKGAYPRFNPGQVQELSEAIKAPEGRVHFAGDQASPYPGWMQGAFHAAHRVIEEIRAGLD